MDFGAAHEEFIRTLQDRRQVLHDSSIKSIARSCFCQIELVSPHAEASVSSGPGGRAANERTLATRSRDAPAKDALRDTRRGVAHVAIASGGQRFGQD
jgi:hypothetical protein